MKKLLLIILAFFSFSNASNAQTSTTSKTKLACYTLSCCGIGSFGIEIWSVKRCHYFYTADAKGTSTHILEFETKEKIDKLFFEEDVILANSYDEDGSVLILPKGNYTVTNNSISFTASKIKLKKYCFEETNSGQLFGHEYNYTITICGYYIGWGKTGSLAITPKLTTEELTKLKETENMIVFNDDKTIDFGNFSYTMKKGSYFVNEDGNIYLESVNLDF